MRSITLIEGLLSGLTIAMTSGKFSSLKATSTAALEVSVAYPFPHASGIKR